MITLKILNVNNSVYKFNGSDGCDYELTIEFQDIEEVPEIGDVIEIHKELLDTAYEGFSFYYTFGNLENKYGKKDISVNDIDVINIKAGEKNIQLKRLYG